MPEPTPSTAALAEAFEAFAERQTFDATPTTLYDPIRYAMAARGKYVRPLLLLQAHALGNADPTPALPAAYAVELFHNFTLLHDDIMDAADTRRGRPSVHIAFNEPTAILAGDAMLIRSYAYLLDHYDGAQAVKLLRLFGDMAARLCEGQQRDMDMEAGVGGAYSYPHYLEMIAGKTGVLITAALTMGATIAGLPEATITRLARAGDLAGRSFQILDDVLDTFSTKELTGKMDYGDVRRGKQSAPFLRALELADAETRVLANRRLPTQPRRTRTSRSGHPSPVPGLRRRGRTPRGGRSPHGECPGGSSLAGRRRGRPRRAAQDVGVVGQSQILGKVRSYRQDLRTAERNFAPPTARHQCLLQYTSSFGEPLRSPQREAPLRPISSKTGLCALGVSFA